MISNIIAESADDNNFINSVKLDVYLSLAIIENYTNITMTEKQKEDVCRLYDLFKGNGILDMVVSEIPETEYKQLHEGLYNCANAIYNYKNSAMGILESVSQDYSNLDLDATSIQQSLADPENMALLKDVLTKLG